MCSTRPLLGDRITLGFAIGDDQQLQWSSPFSGAWIGIDFEGDGVTVTASP